MTRDELLALIAESGETSRDGFLAWLRATGRQCSGDAIVRLCGTWSQARRMAQASAAPSAYASANAAIGHAHTDARRPAEAPRNVDDLPGLDDVRLPVLPDEIDLEALIARRIAGYARKVEAKDARNLAPVRLDCDSRYVGVYIAGDPHVDDDGTDLDTLREHMTAARSMPGILRLCVGDVSNNWVGRLARLYAEQSTSAAEALALVKWFVHEGAWHALSTGNHDTWSGPQDPVSRECMATGTWCEPHGMRFRLVTPRGELRVNMRHQFAGNSQWNPVHAVSKFAQMGIRDDVLIAGHLHVSGYAPILDPDSGRVCHCLQVASYKTHDRYAEERGFMPRAISPAAFLIVDWCAPASSRVTLHWDVLTGVERLRALRTAERVS